MLDENKHEIKTTDYKVTRTIVVQTTEGYRSDMNLNQVETAEEDRDDPEDLAEIIENADDIKVEVKVERA
jgi:hypothetical protein